MPNKYHADVSTFNHTQTNGKFRICGMENASVMDKIKHPEQIHTTINATKQPETTKYKLKKLFEDKVVCAMQRQTGS